MSFQKSKRTNNSEGSLKLHQVLQSYKTTEKKKLLIQNRISIMKMNYERNQRKVQTIETQMEKLREIKDNFKKVQLDEVIMTYNSDEY